MKYECTLTSEDQVYDGDTIKDVELRVEHPDIDVFVGRILDIRIYGIDTPEKRPRKEGRTKASLEAEKAASEEARQALINILLENGGKFTVTDVKKSKLADRREATVLVNGEDVGERLIELGHAKPYFGGTRPRWEF